MTAARSLCEASMVQEVIRMKVLGEPGVLYRSERFFSTPSAMARHLFFYVTRCGHYYCDAEYDFRDDCAVGKMDSHKNFFLIFIRSGKLHFQTAATFMAEQGQIALIDCRMPHRFYATDSAETLWIHFDGAGARAFFDQILTFRCGKQVFFPPADARIEQELAQLISGIRSATLTEVDCSQRIYRMLCHLLFPQSAGAIETDGPVAQAMHYINAHLFEELSVSRVSRAVNLSPSHFSRLFRSSTGFSPHEYIVLHRIDEAKALLHSTSLSVKEIAFRVGYRSEVNFIASFTDKAGVSPSTFRKNPL